MHFHSVPSPGLRGPAKRVARGVHASALALSPLPRARSSRRRVRGRGILYLFDLAFLAAALQGHFFLVDGHGVWVGLFAAARSLEIQC